MRCWPAYLRAPPTLTSCPSIRSRGAWVGPFRPLPRTRERRAIRVKGGHRPWTVERPAAPMQCMQALTTGLQSGVLCNFRRTGLFHLSGSMESRRFYRRWLWMWIERSFPVSTRTVKCTDRLDIDKEMENTDKYQQPHRSSRKCELSDSRRQKWRWMEDC